MIKQYDQLIKFILIGSSGVGKSSLLLQFSDNKFCDIHMTTIGVDFRFKTLKIDGKTIKFQIWDTAGQQRFRTITSAYYKGVDAIIIVYDTTDLESFEDISKYWIPEAEMYAEKGTDIFILGNKSDRDRIVPLQKIDSFAKSHNYQFQEVSAKTADGVYEAFRSFGKKVAQKKRRNNQNKSILDISTMDSIKSTSISTKTEENKKKKTCC